MGEHLCPVLNSCFHFDLITPIPSPWAGGSTCFSWSQLSSIFVFIHLAPGWEARMKR